MTTLKEEIGAMQERIAKAESDRDTWRSSGMQENYLEAYSRVDALELQLEQLRQQGLRASGKHEPAERERLMAEFSITYNGRHYQYARYRYDLLADALDYAKLQRSVLAPADLEAPATVADEVEIPDASQRELMAELAISFQDGVYRLGDYRYERLADAVNYARLRRLQPRRP
jgi:hypothetical protein